MIFGPVLLPKYPILQRGTQATKRLLATVIVQTQKKEYIRNKPHINIGTIGHVDHGKTTLTAAITRHLASKKLAKYVSYENIDKAPDERLRGITINASIVEYTTKKRHYAHSDCPGHIDYIKNMVTGSSLMEYGILVVAATEGVMPQTREHLILARQTNIKQLVVYVNKCDLVDEEMKSLVELEVQELLSQYEYDPDKVPIIFGSALASLTDKNPELGNESIQKLLDTIDNFDDPERIQDAPPVLAIENRYSIKGKGTVVTGKLVQGILKKGLDVTIQGNNQELKTQIVSIETFLKTVTEAHPGDILGVCIKGVKKDHVKRGMILSVPKYMHFGNHFKAKLYILSKQEASIEKPLLHETLLVVYYQTGHITSFVYLPGGENTFILQGDSGECDILMQKKTPMLIGSRFTLRTGSHTIGYGIVSEFKPDLDWFDVEKERKKRRKAEAKALAEEAQG